MGVIRSIYFQADLYERAMRFAGSHGMSLSKLVNEALSHYIGSNGKGIPLEDAMKRARSMVYELNHKERDHKPKEEVEEEDPNAELINTIAQAMAMRSRDPLAAKQMFKDAMWVARRRGLDWDELVTKAKSLAAEIIISS